MNAVFKFIPIDEIMTSPHDSNVLKLATRNSAGTSNLVNMETTSTVTEVNSQTPQIQMSIPAEVTEDPKSSVQVSIGTPLSPLTTESTTTPLTTTDVPTTLTESTITNTFITEAATTTTEITSTTIKEVPTTQIVTTTFPPSIATVPLTTTLGQDNMRKLQEDALFLQNLLGRSAQNINNVPLNDLISSQKPTTVPSRLNTNQNAEQLLQALLSATGQNPTSLSLPTTTINIQQKTTTSPPSTTTRSIEEDLRQYEEDTKLLKALLQATGQNPANFNIPSLNNIDTTPRATFPPTTTTRPTTTRKPATVTPSVQDDLKKFQEDAKLLQALLQATGQNPANFNIPTINNIATTQRPSPVPTTTAKPITTTKQAATTVPSVQDDIKKFQEDAKLLQALLQATGQNPAKFNIPSLNDIITTPRSTTAPTTTARSITTTRKPVTNTPSLEDDLKKFQEDAKLLQALLQATGQNPSTLNIPVLTGVTSNVRKPAKALNPTTMLPRPVYIPDTTTTTVKPPVITTFQPRETTTNVRISTTNPPFTSVRRRIPTTTDMSTTRKSNRNLNLSPRFAVTTETPMSSTFSPQEDLAFLNNLVSKSVYCMLI